MLSQTQINRAKSCLRETEDRIWLVSSRGTYDADQLLKKNDELVFLRRHVKTLKNLLGE